MNRVAVAWGALIAFLVMLISLGLCTLARAQDAGVLIEMEGAADPLAEAQYEAEILEAYLDACATELHRMVAVVEATPEPPSRVVWLTTGIAAGMVLGIVTLEAAR